MSDDRNERMLFAYQVFFELCEEAGGIVQPADALRSIAQKTVIVCNGKALFQDAPLSGSELVEALRAGPKLVATKADELRRATDLWERSFPRRRELNRIIEQFEAGR